MSDLVDSISRHIECVRTGHIMADDIDYSLVDKYRAYFESIDRMNMSALIVVDCFTNKVVYFTQRSNEIFASNFSIDSLPDDTWFRSRVHEDDQFVNDAGARAREFMNKLSLEERIKYKLVYSVRLLNDQGEWIRLLVNDSILEFDKKGNIWLVLRTFDIDHTRGLDEKGCVYFINHVTNQVVFKMFSSEQCLPLLTKRECEVLTHLSNGMSSKQIAELLFISANTVNNHRRNILRKMNVNNVAEAVQCAFQYNLL